MKTMYLAVLFYTIVLPVFGQNKQWLYNTDSTGSRVHNLYQGLDSNSFYSLTLHRDFNKIINTGNTYYRLSKLNNDTITKSVELFKMNEEVGHFGNLVTHRIGNYFLMMVIDLKADTAGHYIVYFDTHLRKDSFKIESPIPIGMGYCYLKQNDSLVIVHADDFVTGGKVYVLFTDSQGRYLSHKRIPHENSNPSPVFNNIVIDPINIISNGEGGYIVTGRRDSIGTNPKKHLFGLNAKGEKTWEYFEPLVGNSFLTGAKLMPDGTILAWGNQWSNMYVGSFTNKGVPIWQKMYYPGNTLHANAAIVNDLQIIDGHMYLLGVTGENILGQNPYTYISTLMKLNMQGEVIWAKGFGNYHDNNLLEHMVFLPPNKFMLGGFCIDSTLTPIHGVSWYVQTDTALNEELPWCRLLPVTAQNYTGINNEPNLACSSCIKVYPNPITEGILHIEIDQAFLPEAQVVLYTNKGIPVLSKTNFQATNSISTQGLAAGNYYLWFKSKNGTSTKKIIIK